MAQIGEGEGTPSGSVVAVDLEAPDDREVLVEGLNTPTGLTATDEALWIVLPDQLLRAPLEGGEPEVVFDEMPNNGRSNGTILAEEGGTLLLDTAGARRGFDAAPNSGTLWRLDPADLPPADGSGGYGTPVLEGMKHAYAVSPVGEELVVTEMSDGSYDGERAPDELVVVASDPGDGPVPTGGWPRCVGDGTPVEEYEGTAEGCAEAVASTTLFEPGATPTGVAVAPWDTDVALVALWNEGRVVAVDLADGDRTDVLEVENPQHLLVDGDAVLLSTFGDGTIRRLADG